jgi:hypothetical protein
MPTVRLNTSGSTLDNYAVSLARERPHVPHAARCVIGWIATRRDSMAMCPAIRIGR